MLIQLTIENFKSIRDEQVIDFYAPVKRDDRAENTFLLEKAKMRVLRTIGFYGANAAGKSNVFNALGTLIALISDRDFKPDGRISEYDPYRLDSMWRKKPSRIEIEFALPVEGLLPYQRFVYEVAFDKKQIHKERLLACPERGRKVVVFSRGKNDTYKTVRMNLNVLRTTMRVTFFQNQTCLSAAWKSADAPSMLRVIASYLCGEFKLSDYRNTSELHSLDRGHIVAALLPYADFGIQKVVTRKRVLDPNRIAAMQRYLSADEFESALAVMQKNEREPEYMFSHTPEMDKDGLIKLDEESEGTQVFFQMLPRVIDNLDNGFTMLDDEMDRSMHPFLAEFIIRLFNDPEVNVNNAQLLFSTHNMALLSESLLRKDQIWFAEKRNGASEYFSLQDFEDEKVTPDSPFASWYCEGRFGGVPRIDYDGFVKAIKRLRKEATNA